MRTVKLLGTMLVGLLAGGLLVSPAALARGGGGHGHGGHKGKNGKPLDRKGLIDKAEEEMRVSDRDQRFLTDRKTVFEAVLQQKRAEVLARHRRMGEDSRRAADARLEVAL